MLPAYGHLGSLTIVYLLGSLVSGCTEGADLDIMMVWDDADVPAASLREPLVARLDEQQGISPFVVEGDFESFDPGRVLCFRTLQAEIEKGSGRRSMHKGTPEAHRVGLDVAGHGNVDVVGDRRCSFSSLRTRERRPQ